MKTEIITALISLAGVIASSVISWFISRNTATNEMKKMKLTWQHEDVVSSDDEFADMAAMVSRCVKFKKGPESEDAAAKVAALRSKESGNLAISLDNLYSCITAQYPVGTKIDAALTEVINEKRKAKGENHTNCAD